MKKIVLLFLLVSSYTFSQSINDYEYVIVPTKFNIFKKEDRYGLNTMTKLLLQKYRFKAYLSNEDISLDFDNQRCNFLYADLVENNALLVTKVKVVLKDCKDNVIFESAFGSSREKDYEIAFKQALREAGKSFDVLHYKYNGKNGVSTETVAKQNESIIQNKTETPTENLPLHSEVLFAKPFGENGFQLLTNNTDVPRYVMTIYKTSSPDCYLVNNSVLLRKSGKWFLEYYKDNQLVSELITIVNLN